ncbi:TWiK family of potassium channels protein 18 [Aphelenchoides fujianensis]|nr:TWiK family of potassium channels protein 18 [Aphelenchoides fujianensis]
MSKKPSQSVSSWATSLAPIGENSSDISAEVFEDEYFDFEFERENSVSSILRKAGTVRNYSVDTDQSSNRRVAFAERKDGLEEENEQTSGSTPPAHNDVDDLQPILVPLAKRRQEITARQMCMKKIDDTMAERVFIVDSQTGGGLFPRMLLDQRTVRRNILNKRRAAVFKVVAKLHHKFGLRHYLLIAFVGGLFHARRTDLENNIKQLEKLTQDMTSVLFKVLQRHLDRHLTARAPFSEFYQRMLKVENRYIGSAYHKYEVIDERLTWNYGRPIGKAMSIIYATIGIPIMLVVLSDVGKVLLHWFTYAYNAARRAIMNIKIKIKRKTAASKKPTGPRWRAGRPRTSCRFPMWLTVPIVILYLLLCSLVVCGFDYNDGSSTNLSFGDSFYFSYVLHLIHFTSTQLIPSGSFSLSTIGLGDVLPNKIEYSPFLALMFLGGLALFSVVNTTVYETMEGKLLEGVTRMEEWLESVHYYRHGREGYFVFKSLSPNIQLLALALPIFDDFKEEQIEGDARPREHSARPAAVRRGGRPPDPLADRRGHQLLPAHARHHEHELAAAEAGDDRRWSVPRPRSRHPRWKAE